ncbi:MAG: flavodoxin domain-containing protein [Flavisolibacter sp.]
MKGIIVYETKYGATRQYAEWLGEDLKLPLAIAKEVPANRLQSFDFVLIGTPVYMGKLRIKNWLKKGVKSLAGKKLVLFIVNDTSPDEQLKREKFIVSSVPPELRHLAGIYFLAGRLRHKDLTWLDRLLLKVGERTLTPEKRKAIHHDLDEVKRENIQPLVKAVQSFITANITRVVMGSLPK